ncbi:MAG TPA: endonuclease/exonuclease/phosphatase family protein [Candidatus Acidoferrum sp.]|nr:endonuclease/exonuclease/phosphatase family protein [Candidatus Acidoferrum sp.]
MRLSLGLAIATSTLPSLADNLRVTTWNLQSPSAEATGGTNTSIQRWAATLTKLHPDVILLQGVSDWQMCAQLAEALKPAEFNIAICSSFRPAQGQAGGRQQVAILSRQKAYFSWSAAWRTPGDIARQGGFAFAALQAGRLRVGLFCAEFGAGAGLETQVRPLLDELNSVKRWEMNQVQSFVVAATFGDLDKTASTAREKTVRLLEEAGFVDPLLQLPARQRITFIAKAGQPGVTADYLLVEPSIFPSPQIPTTAGWDHNPVTCDLELDSAKAAVAWTERARQAELLSQAQAARSQPPAAAEGSAADGSSLAARFGDTGLVWLVALAGIVLGFVALVVALTKNRKRVPAVPVLIPEHAESAKATGASYTVVVAPRSVTGSSPEAAPRGSASQPVIHIEPPDTQTQSAAWQQRALAAEERAERAQAAVRRGVLPHLRRWLRQKMVRKLATDRARLLDTQQAATRKALSVDERLSRIELQLQRQNRAYERWIEGLTCELVAAKEENRELIRARIAQVKLEMEAARARLLAQAEAPEGGA